MWISVEKIAMCVSGVETFQTFLEPNVLIVEKLLSVLWCFKLVNNNKNKERERERQGREEENRKRTQLGNLMVSGPVSCLALSSDS